MIKIGKKNYNNLPEQVEANTEKTNNFDSRITDLENSVPEKVETAVEPYLTQTEKYAENARSSASDASVAATNAHTFAVNAEASAVKASGYADTAKGIKTECASIASGMSDKIADATAEAISTATGVSTNNVEKCKTYSESCEAFEKQCSENAISAKTYSENAKTYSENAKVSIEEALTSSNDATLGITDVQAITIKKQNIIDYICDPKNFTWKQIQRIVRMGCAHVFFDVGDQLVVKRGDDDIVFDILGFDQETPVDTDHTHSMTLGMHYGYTSLAFDMGEALIYCVTDLPAGDYKFTYKTNTYYFNMPKVAKAGSQLKTTERSETPSTIYVYDSATSASASQTISLSTTAIEGACDLGTFKGNDSSLVEDATVNGATIKRNDLYRAAYGSNNWENSSIRQWLQADGTKGNWWKAKSVFDRIPSYATNNNGFLYGLDPELVSVIGKVKKNTALNNIKEGGGTITLEESVFLLSMGEIGMKGYTAQGDQYEYFRRKCGGTMADNWSTAYPGLVKTYASGSQMWWWLRSPNTGGTNCTRYVSGSGVVANYLAVGSCGVVAALSII